MNIHKEQLLINVQFKIFCSACDMLERKLTSRSMQICSIMLHKDLLIHPSAHLHSGDNALTSNNEWAMTQLFFFFELPLAEACWGVVSLSPTHSLERCWSQSEREQTHTTLLNMHKHTATLFAVALYSKTIDLFMTQRFKKLY